MTESNKTSTPNVSAKNLEANVDAAFDRLPILGPVAWLYGRTPDRKFLFLSDLDWAVFPAITLDQCRLSMKGKMPFGFITWASVSDEINLRLLSGNNKLAPHEWKSGPHLWLIDIVAPFGGLDEMFADLHKAKFPDQASLRYLWPNIATQKLEVKYYQPPVSPSIVKEQKGTPVAAPPSASSH